MKQNEWDSNWKLVADFARTGGVVKDPSFITDDDVTRAVTCLFGERPGPDLPEPVTSGSYTFSPTASGNLRITEGNGNSVGLVSKLSLPALRSLLDEMIRQDLDKTIKKNSL